MCFLVDLLQKNPKKKQFGRFWESKKIGASQSVSIVAAHVPVGAQEVAQVQVERLEKVGQVPQLPLRQHLARRRLQGNDRMMCDTGFLCVILASPV